MNSIPNRLKTLRKQNNLTQAEVANRLGVTPALVSSYENAERYPSLEKLVMLADIRVFQQAVDKVIKSTRTTQYAMS